MRKQDSLAFEHSEINGDKNEKLQIETPKKVVVTAEIEKEAILGTITSRSEEDKSSRKRGVQRQSREEQQEFEGMSSFQHRQYMWKKIEDEAARLNEEDKTQRKHLQQRRSEELSVS